MEIFTNKSLVLKIVIALVIVILFNFCAPTLSHAGLFEAIGGTLLDPIIQLLLAIGDGAINLIQNILFGMDNSLLQVAIPQQGFWETVGMVIGAIAGVATVVAITIFTGGAALAAIVPTLVAAGVGAFAGYSIAVAALPDKFYLPVYAISPEEIFANKIGLLDVNFFNPNDYGKIEMITGDPGENDSTAANLQATISSWYLTLRNFALVVLLVVLLYIGIRIVTSSAAQDRAKYKEKLFSWIVAMCLLFFMHYIMAFATTIVESISEGINSESKPVIITLPDLSKEGYEVEITTTDPNSGEKTTGGTPVEEFFGNEKVQLIAETPILDANGNVMVDGDGNVMKEKKYAWPTNLMGTLRVDMQMDEDLTQDNQLLRQLGYVVLFLVMVFYTIAFLVVYIRRLIMLAFLTMIAPLVAMTYPLDKMNDGNAQAFNMWIKEYVFNLLIQPFHLILYTMLVGSAIDFAHKNMIYAIVAIGFIFQAEKILRKFFGFDKASTLDTNGSTVGGMLAMAGINQLKRIGNMGKKKDGKNGGNSGNGNTSPRLRTADRGKSAAERLNAGVEDDQRPSIREQEGQQLEMEERAYNSEDRQESLESRMAMNARNASQTGQDYRALRNLVDEGELDKHDPRYRELKDEIRENDNRGLGQAIYDRYQGSALQAHLQTSAPARLVRKIGGGIQSARDFTGRQIRKIPAPLRNTIRGATSTVGKGIKYAVPRAAKLYAKGALAATAGTIGVAAGLASDNDMNILKYGGAGAATGWAVGSAAGGIVSNAGHKVEEIGENIASTYTVSAKGQEAEKARLQAKEDKAAMKDEERQKLYMEKLKISKSQIKDVMKDAQEYRESGVTDDRLIIKAMNAKGFGEGRANNERVILAQLANETGKDNKKIEDIKKRLSSRGLSNEDVNKYIDGIREITGAV